MARYLGSVCKVCRRHNEKLFLKGERCMTPKCSVEKRGRPQGRRRKISDRGVQLLEKQKARYQYGMLEAQFRRFFAEGARLPGVTGDNLQVLLERRLDNVIYNIGFADSRPQARQLVRHGHITVNGHRVDVPSYLTKEGDSIGWTQGGAKTKYYKQVQESVQSKAIPGWLNLNKDTMVGQIISVPTPDQASAKVDGKVIVEYYSR
jgi:small subunit ribosomal protein S4